MQIPCLVAIQRPQLELCYQAYGALKPADNGHSNVVQIQYFQETKPMSVSIFLSSLISTM